MSTDTSQQDYSLLESLPAVDPGYDWYLVNTSSGWENKAKKNIEIRTKNFSLESEIIQVLVPTRETVSIKSGKSTVTREKLYPGYILVFMKLDLQSFTCVKDSPGVTSFVNVELIDPVTNIPKFSPVTMTEQEMEEILDHIKRPTNDLHIQFLEGDTVAITTGPMVDFRGTVKHMNSAKGTLSVLLSIFGRDTIVDVPAEICSKEY